MFAIQIWSCAFSFQKSSCATSQRWIRKGKQGNFNFNQSCNVCSKFFSIWNFSKLCLKYKFIFLPDTNKASHLCDLEIYASVLINLYMFDLVSFIFIVFCYILNFVMAGEPPSPEDHCQVFSSVEWIHIFNANGRPYKQ